MAKTFNKRQKHSQHKNFSHKCARAVTTSGNSGKSKYRFGSRYWDSLFASRLEPSLQLQYKGAVERCPTDYTEVSLILSKFNRHLPL